MFKKRDVAEMEATKQSKKGTYLKRGLISLLAVTTVASSMFALTSAFLSDKKTVTNTFELPTFFTPGSTLIIPFSLS